MITQEKLQLLEERQRQLLEEFLEESDPKEWREGAGDRYWDKKNAAATLAIVCRIQTLFQQVMVKTGGKDAPDAPAEAFDIEAAEKRALKQAEKILEGIEQRSRPEKKKR